MIRHSLKEGRWIYIAVFLITLFLHGMGHRYGLPYIENYDEGRLFYSAALQRGSAQGIMDLAGYPPGIFWIYGVVQPISELITNRPSELEMGFGVGIVRALTVIANAISVVLIVWGGRRLTRGWAVGLLAALAWVTAPDTLYNNVIALTEPFVIVSTLLAFSFALSALYERSRRDAILSIAAALVAVVFKYTAFPSLGLGIGVALWFTRFERRWWKTLALQVGLIAATALFLVIAVGVLDLLTNHSEAKMFTQSGFSRLLDRLTWELVLRGSTDQLHITFAALVMALMVGTIAVALSGNTTLRLAWFGLWALIVSTLAATVMYMIYSEGLFRYVAPSSPFIALAVSLALWSGVSIFVREQSSLRYAPSFVLMAAAFVWVMPTLRTTASILDERMRPDTRAALATWSLPIMTTPGENIIQDTRDLRVFVRDRAGYRGLWHFQDWRDPFEQTPQQWRDEKVNWLMATSETQQCLTETDEGRVWARDTLFLKSFPPEGEIWRGPSIWFYRLTPPQHSADVVWNEAVHLIGYDVAPSGTIESLEPGQSLTFTGYWRADRPLTEDLRLFVHIRPSDDLTQVVAQSDGRPVADRPSTTWTDSRENLIGTPYTVMLPTALASGRYSVIIGLYDGATGARWIMQEGTDGLEIQTFKIGDV